MADDVKHVEMLVVSGSNDDIQWFEYVINFFAGRTRVEWDKDTMFATLPAETANFLISRKYARPATDAEVKKHTKSKTKASPAPAATTDVEPPTAQEPLPPPDLEQPVPKPRAKRAPNKGETS